MINWTDYQFEKKTILIVEDTESSILFFNAALSRSKAKLLWAKDGAEAIERFISNYADIDIVLLDLNLPKVSGFDVLKKIRNISSEIPVIVQTAYLFSNERKSSMDLGANDFISKPIQLDELLENMAKYLNTEYAV